MKKVSLLNPAVEILLSDDDGIIFHVQSGSSEKWHTVGYDPRDGWICTCEHYHFRKKWCKHMRACVKYAENQGVQVFDRRVYNEKINCEAIV